MQLETNECESTGMLVKPKRACHRLEIHPGMGLVFRQHVLPGLKPYEIEVLPAYSYISAGTEINNLQKFKNELLGSCEPVNSGYSLSGVVLGVGQDVRDIRVGDKVVAIGQGAFHADRVIVSHNLATIIPEGVCLQQACMTAMFCFALEGVHKMAGRLNENTVVFGAGMMGQMTARLLGICGQRVAVVDVDAFRLSLLPDNILAVPLSDEGWDTLRDWAEPYGVESASIAFGGDATSVVERLKDIMMRSPDGVPHGRIVFPGGARISLVMASNMGNIQLMSSAKAGPGYRDPQYESGRDYPSGYVSHPVKRNAQTYLELLKSGRMDFLPLITHVFAFSEAERAYDLLESTRQNVMAVLLDYHAGVSA